MSDINPYGVEVGQVWEDNDYRTDRTVTILAVDLIAGFAHVVSSTGRKSKIRLNRFRRNSTGYFLVQSGKHK